MIESFRDARTVGLFLGNTPKGFPADVIRRVSNKLALIDEARSIEALRVPPGNRLEPLKGDRIGQHNIRVNRQWRICFEWHDGGAWNVEVTDYH